MKHFAIFVMATATMLTCMSGAFAQGAKDVIGSWVLVSNTTERDGKSTDTFGPNPKGTAIFDSNGRFAITIVRADLPKIASNNRTGATADES